MRKGWDKYILVRYGWGSAKVTKKEKNMMWINLIEHIGKNKKIKGWMDVGIPERRIRKVSGL